MLDCDINSSAFDKLRSDFDILLVDTLNKMKQKGSEDASLTIKVDIELEKTFAPFGAGTREIYIPHFSHKVTSAMQIKAQRVGACEEEFELVWDENLQRYMLYPIGQMTLDLAELARKEDEDE